MFTRIAIVMAALFSLSACQKEAQSSVYSGDFKVQKLFTVDGCTVYRFQDDRSVYFSNCKGTVSSQYSCGKNCTRDQITNTDVTQ